MRAKCVEDLQIWQRAMEFWKVINAILDRPRLASDRKLHDQLSDAADSIVSNIAEGFEQPTDRAFAAYLYTGKGSTAEARTRLQLAHLRGYIETTEYNERDKLGDELARMITGLIKYLLRSNRRNRGLGPK
jgi:four helix bundle protein